MMVYVTPIHKGGSKQKPEQYRPVSLTSHIMKFFERVIKKKVMEHLVNDKMFNDGQHDFVPGRSTYVDTIALSFQQYIQYTDGRKKIGYHISRFCQSI